ncbi:hypothetical protein HAX54_044416 [Datura stramonium]|uniref:Uncharacterized protein n=1 Tax=Datura stramonium TaxID=4076 RepID=A0ABS8WGA2_DATST|nr:hypothetical protein [Datura stramonium]
MNSTEKTSRKNSNHSFGKSQNTEVIYYGPSLEDSACFDKIISQTNSAMNFGKSPFGNDRGNQDTAFQKFSTDSDLPSERYEQATNGNIPAKSRPKKHKFNQLSANFMGRRLLGAVDRALTDLTEGDQCQIGCFPQESLSQQRAPVFVKPNTTNINFKEGPPPEISGNGGAVASKHQINNSHGKSMGTELNNNNTQKAPINLEPIMSNLKSRGEQEYEKSPIRFSNLGLLDGAGAPMTKKPQIQCQSTPHLVSNVLDQKSPSVNNHINSNYQNRVDLATNSARVTVPFAEINPPQSKIIPDHPTSVSNPQTNFSSKPNSIPKITNFNSEDEIGTNTIVNNSLLTNEPKKFISSPNSQKNNPNITPNVSKPPQPKTYSNFDNNQPPQPIEKQPTPKDKATKNFIHSPNTNTKANADQEPAPPMVIQSLATILRTNQA